MKINSRLQESCVSNVFIGFKVKFRELIKYMRNYIKSPVNS